MNSEGHGNDGGNATRSKDAPEDPSGGSDTQRTCGLQSHTLPDSVPSFLPTTDLTVAPLCFLN